MTKNKNFNSDFKKAKGMGSAKHGSGHWLMQRLTALILVLSGIWVFYFSKNISGQEMSDMVTIIQRPEHIVPLIIFFITGFYHAALGMQVIIEDYIQNFCFRNAIIISIKIFSFITIIAGNCALIYLMVL